MTDRVAASPRDVLRRVTQRRLGPCLLAIALVAVGCSNDAGQPSSSNTASTSIAATREPPAPASPAQPPPAQAPESERPEVSEPLVIAHSPARRPVNFSERRARAFVDGQAPRWATVLPASELDASQAVATIDGIDPLTSPDDYPLQTAGPEPGTVTTVRVVGDIMLGRRVAAAHPGDDPVAALRPLADHLGGADLTVGNLESTLSTAGPPTQSPPSDSFSVPPATAGALSDLGVDAVSLANNHTGDFGETALLDTVRRLRAGGLPAFGAGGDLAAASRPVLLKHDGVTFGFVGFNAIGETPQAAPGSPGALSVRMPPRTGPLNEADLAHALGLVRRLDRKVDVVIALPHWARSTPTSPSRCRRRSGAGSSRRARTWSSADTRTGSRGSNTSRPRRTVPAAPFWPTRWATWSSTWTSWSRPWKASP